MALNIKDAETVRLAAEVAALTGESKTRAVRQALAERRERLILARGGGRRSDRVRSLLERDVWPRLADGVRAVPLTKEEEEAILGFGPDGA